MAKVCRGERVAREVIDAGAPSGLYVAASQQKTYNLFQREYLSQKPGNDDVTG